MSQATANNTGERLSGAEAAMARRRARSLYGKAGLAGGKTPAATSSTPAHVVDVAPAKQETPEAPASSCGCQHPETISARIEEAQPTFTPDPISAALLRRMQRSKTGRGDTPACRPCGRIPPEPPKVEIGTTLSGTPVSGTQVERTSRVTGSESGSCRAITGTEYIGTEQYGELCGTRPAPMPAKVGINSTSRGGLITGTEIGRSRKMTGDEPGTCKRITGSEYIAAEQAGEFCGTTPEPHPQKSVMGMTAKRNAISGSDLARETRVTGGESGASRAITGSAYADAQALRGGAGDAPKKSQTSRTSAGGAVSGTLLGRSSKTTGDEAGACKRVTGSDYINTEEFVSFCRAEPYQAPAKTGVSRTLHGQDVSGTQVGRSGKVTGDEYGACKPVTGTSYIGADQYAEFCASRAAAEAINRARLGRNAALTGTQPGPDAKLTGNERGECQDISGTPYLGDDQQAAACGQLPMAMHHRSRGPAGAAPSPSITGNAANAQANQAAGQFSISTPARAMRASETQRVTGSAYGGTGRITGPLARATGLVSGTPEFRYREEAAAPAPIPAPIIAATEPAPERTNTDRVTGEGRERHITGDAWDRSGRITGTEGQSATRRNPTQRGDARGAGMNARTPREVETPAPATSRITGSSGNSHAGATITLSGGARG